MLYIFTQLPNRNMFYCGCQIFVCKQLKINYFPSCHELRLVALSLRNPNKVAWSLWLRPDKMKFPHSVYFWPLSDWSVDVFNMFSSAHFLGSPSWAPPSSASLSPVCGQPELEARVYLGAKRKAIQELRAVRWRKAPLLGGEGEESRGFDLFSIKLWVVRTSADDDGVLSSLGALPVPAAVVLLCPGKARRAAAAHTCCAS